MTLSLVPPILPCITNGSNQDSRMSTPLSEPVNAAPKVSAILRRYGLAAAAFRQHEVLNVDTQLAMTVESSLSSGEIDALKAVGYTESTLVPGTGELDPLTATTTDYLALLSTSLTVADTAARLHVDRSRIRQRLRARSLFGIEHNGEWRLPLFQFERDQPLPGLGDVLLALPADLTALDVAEWFIVPSLDLEQRDHLLSPRTWLLRGLPVARVCEIACGL